MTALAAALICNEMLQHNTARAGKRAHVAHAAMMGLHAFCCGLPALAMAAAAISGTTSGAALLQDRAAEFHGLLHAHEVWILVVSAGLVLIGGALEASARRARVTKGFPVMFALSVACFAMNVAIILAHRGI